MENNDQITALAREYAEEMIKGKPSEKLPNCLKNSMMAMNTEYIAEVFQWLTRRVSLVEKSKLEEAYKSSKHYFEHTDSSNPTQKQYFWGRMCAIESLFPEIAKEVEG